MRPGLLLLSVLTACASSAPAPQFEDRAAVEALARLGPVNEWPDRDVYFGGVHVAIPGLEGAGDPRRGGSAMALR